MPHGKSLALIHQDDGTNMLSANLVKTGRSTGVQTSNENREDARLNFVNNIILIQPHYQKQHQITAFCRESAIKSTIRAK
jgi:hypothetical protein